MTIEIYRLTSVGYDHAATINDDGTVEGTHWFADHLRDTFASVRAEGGDPANRLDSIHTRLVQNWAKTGYWEVNRS